MGSSLYAQVTFTDVTSGPLGDAGKGICVAWGDYDNDGKLDIFLTNQGVNRLFHNEGGGAFTDATSGPLGDTGVWAGAAWGDYDNDGYLDLYVANQGANRLFHNEGPPSFSFADATNGPLGDTGDGRGVAWGDYDGDGYIDLYLANTGGANKLFHNNGDDTFTDVTSGPLGNTGNGRAVAWGDYDNDGDLDIYLVNEGQANKLFVNQGGGVFTDGTSGPLGDTGPGKGLAPGDYDNDGDLDLYVANFNSANKLLRNEGAGVFTDATTAPLNDTGPGRGVVWGDYDNDGKLDLYLAMGVANKLFHNEGAGGFTDVTTGPLGDTGNGHGVAWGDYDNDGDLDLYVANYLSANKLLRNDCNTGNHWLHVNLKGVISNACGIGARVRVVAGGFSQMNEISGGCGYLSQNSLTAEFGLGAATVVDTLEINWPSGIVQRLTAVDVDTAITVVEVKGPAATLTKALDGGYYEVDRFIRFRYIEEYNRSYLLYRVYDASRSVVIDNGTLSVPTHQGVNWLAIDGNSWGRLTDGSFYVLEVETAKGDVYKMRFLFRETVSSARHRPKPPGDRFRSVESSN